MTDHTSFLQRRLVVGPIFSRNDIPHFLFDGLPFLRNEVSRATLPNDCRKIGQGKKAVVSHRK